MRSEGGVLFSGANQGDNRLFGSHSKLTGASAGPAQPVSPSPSSLLRLRLCLPSATRLPFGQQHAQCELLCWSLLSALSLRKDLELVLPVLQGKPSSFYSLSPCPSGIPVLSPQLRRTAFLSFLRGKCDPVNGRPGCRALLPLPALPGLSVPMLE